MRLDYAGVRSLPKTTLAGPGENKAEGRKLDKDRVTLLACANASGASCEHDINSSADGSGSIRHSKKILLEKVDAYSVL